MEQWLDHQIDRRLARTFFLALVAIGGLRHSLSGLLLSELGAHIISPAHAPARTKRLSNLLRSAKWPHTLLERFLWRRADRELARLEGRGGPALAIWDESVLEMPESIALEGLCPVGTGKAARLKRIKPGYYHPPGGPPVFVPGLQWLTVMLAMGDCHAVVGDGAVGGTGAEYAADSHIRVAVERGMRIKSPGAISPDYFVVLYYGEELGPAMKGAVRSMVDFPVREKGMEPYDAYTLCSLAGDVRMSRTFRPISTVKMMLDRRALEQLG